MHMQSLLSCLVESRHDVMRCAAIRNRFDVVGPLLLRPQSSLPLSFLSRHEEQSLVTSGLAMSYMGFDTAGHLSRLVYK